MNIHFKVTQSPDFIFECLTNMQKFVSVHPLISKAEDLANGKYLIHETLKIGFVPISFTYPATVKSNASDLSVKMNATVMRVARIEMNFKIIERKDYCSVEETVTFKSPLPVKFIMQKIFKKQHKELFKNIEKAKQ